MSNSITLLLPSTAGRRTTCSGSRCSMQHANRSMGPQSRAGWRRCLLRASRRLLQRPLEPRRACSSRAAGKPRPPQRRRQAQAAQQRRRRCCRASLAQQLGCPPRLPARRAAPAAPQRRHCRPRCCSRSSFRPRASSRPGWTAERCGPPAAACSSIASAEAATADRRSCGWPWSCAPTAAGRCTRCGGG